MPSMTASPACATTRARKAPRHGTCGLSRPGAPGWSVATRPPPACALARETRRGHQPPAQARQRGAHLRSAARSAVRYVPSPRAATRRSSSVRRSSALHEDGAVSGRPPYSVAQLGADGHIDAAPVREVQACGGRCPVLHRPGLGSANAGGCRPPSRATSRALTAAGWRAIPAPHAFHGSKPRIAGAVEITVTRICQCAATPPPH